MKYPWIFSEELSVPIADVIHKSRAFSPPCVRHYVRTCLWLFISIFALLLKGDATKQFRIHLSPFHFIKAHRKMYPSKYQSANLYFYSFCFLWGLSQWFMLRTKNIASIFCSTLLLAGIFYQKTYLKKIVFPHDQFRATHSTNDDIPS